MNRAMADTIESLRADLERKSDAIQRLWRERDELRAEVAKLRSAVLALRGRLLWIDQKADTREIDAQLLGTNVGAERPGTVLRDGSVRATG